MLESAAMKWARACPITCRTATRWITGRLLSTPGVAFLFDPLTAVMLCVVTGIGFLITVFAAGYMKGEEGYFRFFAYLACSSS